MKKTQGEKQEKNDKKTAAQGGGEKNGKNMLQAETVCCFFRAFFSALVGGREYE